MNLTTLDPASIAALAAAIKQSSQPPPAKEPTWYYWGWPDTKDPLKKHRLGLGSMYVHIILGLFYAALCLAPIFYVVLITPGGIKPFIQAHLEGTILWLTATTLALPTFIWLEAKLFEKWCRTHQATLDLECERHWFYINAGHVENFWKALAGIFAATGLLTLAAKDDPTATAAASTAEGCAHLQSATSFHSGQPPILVHLWDSTWSAWDHLGTSQGNVIAALIAIIGVFITARHAQTTARQTRISSTLAADRLTWLKDLRQHTADLRGALTALRLETQLPKSTPPSTEQEARRIQAQSESHRLITLIKLMLMPEHPRHLDPIIQSHAEAIETHLLQQDLNSADQAYNQLSLSVQTHCNEQLRIANQQVHQS